MPRIVVKFGGSSVGDSGNFFDSEHMIRIADTIKRLISEGFEVIVVISAMAGETRRLKAMCKQISPIENTFEDDLVLTAGEQISTGLICKLLNSEKYNLRAQAFLSWQIPIITDDSFSNAKIKKIETQKLEDALKSGIIPVVAGYQGITEKNMITTLGFDGSDTTAVAVAAALKADVCQFYKDVLGVFTANPRRVPKAKKIEKISNKEMFVLASLGARILHPLSLKTSIENKLTLKICPNFIDDESGTTITDGDFIEDYAGITYFEHSESKITISVVGKNISSKNGDEILKELNKNKIFAEVVKTEFDEMSVTLEIGWVEQLDKSLRAIHTLYGFDDVSTNEKQAFRGEGKQIYIDPAIKTQ